MVVLSSFTRIQQSQRKSINLLAIQYRRTREDFTSISAPPSKIKRLFMMASGHGERTWRKSGRRDIHLSKSLTYVLRHKAVELGLEIDSGGFIDVDDLLSHSMFKQYTQDDIKTAVADSDKQRFSLREHPDSRKLQICANQGHSLSLPDLELTPISAASQYPTVLHGTYFKYWVSIKKQGLGHMNRTHIHFAQGEPGDSGVISGMRRSCELMIFLDLEKALRDGLSFYLSKNGVILCPGDENGFIHPTYFKQVIQTRTRRVMPL